jgi:diguanylate cyclase (GGDEF)-like protein
MAAWLAAALDGLPVGVMVCEQRDGGPWYPLHVSERVRDILSCPPGPTGSVDSLLGLDGAASMATTLSRTLAQGARWTATWGLAARPGARDTATRWVELTVTPLPAPAGTAHPHSLWALRDVTGEVAQARALAQAREQAARALDFAGVGHLQVQLDSGLATLCARQAQLLDLGTVARETDWDEIRQRLDPEHLTAFDNAIEHCVRTGLPLDLETHLRASQASGAARWLHWRGEVVAQRSAAADGEPVRRLMLSLISQDVSSRREMLESLSYRAHHDALTGLPNRLLLEDRLASAIRLAERDRTCCALLFIDLDGFKLVNDRFGHDAGDHVLRTVAQRLRQSVRRSDTVARLGGDEFVVLLPRVADLRHAEQARDKIRHQLRSAIAWGPHALAVGASVGVAAYPDHALDAAELLTMADREMYRAKAVRGSAAA